MKEIGISILAGFFLVALLGLSLYAYQAEGLSSWRREGLKAELDQLRADHDALALAFADVSIKLQEARSAGAFCMAYQVERHSTLRDANFPVGYELADVAGVWHPLTQADLDALAASAALAEAHYTALTTP